MTHTRITPRVIERINAKRHGQPRFGTPEYAAAMRPFVKDVQDRAIERALGPAEPNPKLIEKRIQSLAILIAVELSHQRNELDNLGDNESVVLVGKCPTINLVQLAEKIDAYYKLDAAALEKRIEELKLELENAHYEAMGEDL